MANKKNKKKQTVTIYNLFSKNRKGIVMGISLLLAFMMLIGVFGQFAI